MKKRKNPRDSWQFLPLVLLVLVLLGVLCGMQLRMNDLSGQQNVAEQEYRYHFAMVIDNDESPFWQLVYSGARQRAQEHDAWLELLCDNVRESFYMDEQLQIANYAGVDGLIVAPDGAKATNEAIKQIAQNTQRALPVLALMNNDSDSNRTGYVGINHYEQGHAYGQLIAELDKPVTRVTLLMNAEDDESTAASGNVLYTSLVETLAEKNLSEQIAMHVCRVDHQNIFASENGIKQLFRNEELPDVLICPDYRFTASAAKVLVEQNLVGKVSLLGASMSSDILEYVRKGTIAAVVTVDPRKLGSTAIDEMLEIMQNGRASDFTTLETIIIDQGNADQYAIAFAEENS